ncbi:MAG: flavodoxin family protein [Anaerococcus sp.]
MNIAIRYYSKTGNTKKIADAIAEQLNVEAFDLTKPVPSDTDILFLGSSVYAAGVADEVKDFISTLKKDINVVVNFSTAAFLESTYKQVKKLLEERNIPISDEEFHCRGKFTMIHRDHPNQEDLKDAKLFAKKVLEKYKK